MHDMDGEPASQTDSPPVAAWATQDRRSASRKAVVLLVGRVFRGSRVAACLVHDLSKTGLMARFTTQPMVGERLEIEVRGLAPAAGTVRWVNDRKAGIEFDTPQDIDSVFKVKQDDGRIARSPRFPMNAVARLRFDDARFTAELLDISPGGAKLNCEIARVRKGQTGQVMLPDSGTSAYGTVCWTRDTQFGFRFVQALSLDTLTRILGREDIPGI